MDSTTVTGRASGGAGDLLADRILDSLPSGDYAIGALLRLVDVVESDSVETAAVECVASPRLLINPAFVEKHCPTSDTLLMLVMHELYHVLLGHTRQFPRVTPVENLVFDAVINSMLCRMFPEPSFTSFFTRLYKANRFPECLLRPPPGWKPSEDPIYIRLPAALAKPGQRAAASVYRALYSEVGASYEELYEILARKVSEQLAAAVMLLGDHVGPSDGDGPAGSSMLFEVLEQLVDGWPESPEPVRGRSLGELLETTRVRIGRSPRSNRQRLRTLIHQVGGSSGKSWSTTRWEIDERSVQGPIPVFDRRNLVMRAMGQPPLLYANPLSRRRQRQVRDGERVHIYVDVSGSIGELKGALYGAVLDCHELVEPQVHLFSTEVANVSLAELRRGTCHTTGGTSIACVADHMMQSAVNHAVLVTDGYVGISSQSQRRILADARLGVALAGQQTTGQSLKDVTDFWTKLKF